MRMRNLIPVLRRKLIEFDEIASERQLTESEMNTVELLVSHIDLVRKNEDDDGA